MSKRLAELASDERDEDLRGTRARSCRDDDFDVFMLMMKESRRSTTSRREGKAK